MLMEGIQLPWTQICHLSYKTVHNLDINHIYSLYNNKCTKKITCKCYIRRKITKINTVKTNEIACKTF